MRETRINVLGDPSGEELRSLHAWLSRDGALRGRVRSSPGSPRPGAAEALLVSLARGGVATLLSAALIAWLRQRTGDLSVTLTRDGDGDGGTVTLTARELRVLDAAGLDRRVGSLASRLRG